MPRDFRKKEGWDPEKNITQHQNPLVSWFPDSGNWCIFRSDFSDSFVAEVRKVDKVVGYDIRHVGRSISASMSGEDRVFWANWYREYESWRIELTNGWCRVSFDEVFDTEAEALSKL